MFAEPAIRRAGDDGGGDGGDGGERFSALNWEG
jgi:hypothetical protein